VTRLTGGASATGGTSTVLPESGKGAARRFPHINLSVLKNGRARAIRFSTLAAICAALECQPGDLLTYKG
jgi:hypothetical protein